MEQPTQSVDQRAFRDLVPIAVSTLVWMATLALARFGHELLWDEQPVATWLAIGLNIAAGVVVIVVHFGYLRRVDELQRKILVDAMAVALGVGLVGGFAYAVASGAGLVTIDGDIGYFSALMAAVYAIASVAGTIRYR